MDVTGIDHRGRTVLLSDTAQTTRILREQAMAALELRCSVCEARVGTPSELDASGRCDRCTP